MQTLSNPWLVTQEFRRGSTCTPHSEQNTVKHAVGRPRVHISKRCGEEKIKAPYLWLKVGMEQNVAIRIDRKIVSIGSNLERERKKNLRRIESYHCAGRSACIPNGSGQWKTFILTQPLRGIKTLIWNHVAHTEHYYLQMKYKHIKMLATLCSPVSTSRFSFGSVEETHCHIRTT